MQGANAFRQTSSRALAAALERKPRTHQGQTVEKIKSAVSSNEAEIVNAFEKKNIFMRGLAIAFSWAAEICHQDAAVSEMLAALDGDENAIHSQSGVMSAASTIIISTIKACREAESKTFDTVRSAMGRSGLKDTPFSVQKIGMAGHQCARLSDLIASAIIAGKINIKDLSDIVLPRRSDLEEQRRNLSTCGLSQQSDTSPSETAFFERLGEVFQLPAGVRLTTADGHPPELSGWVTFAVAIAELAGAHGAFASIVTQLKNDFAAKTPEVYGRSAAVATEAANDVMTAPANGFSGGTVNFEALSSLSQDEINAAVGDVANCLHNTFGVEIDEAHIRDVALGSVSDRLRAGCFAKDTAVNDSDDSHELDPGEFKSGDDFITAEYAIALGRIGFDENSITKINEEKSAGKYNANLAKTLASAIGILRNAAKNAILQHRTPGGQTVADVAADVRADGMVENLSAIDDTTKTLLANVEAATDIAEQAAAAAPTGPSISTVSTKAETRTVIVDAIAQQRIKQSAATIVALFGAGNISDTTFAQPITIMGVKCHRISEAVSVAIVHGGEEISGKIATLLEQHRAGQQRTAHGNSTLLDDLVEAIGLNGENVTLRPADPAKFNGVSIAFLEAFVAISAAYGRVDEKNISCEKDAAKRGAEQLDISGENKFAAAISSAASGLAGSAYGALRGDRKAEIDSRLTAFVNAISRTLDDDGREQISQIAGSQFFDPFFSRWALNGFCGDMPFEIGITSITSTRTGQYRLGDIFALIGAQCPSGMENSAISATDTAAICSAANEFRKSTMAAIGKWTTAYGEKNFVDVYRKTYIENLGGNHSSFIDEVANRLQETLDKFQRAANQGALATDAGEKEFIGSRQEAAAAIGEENAIYRGLFTAQYGDQPPPNKKLVDGCALFLDKVGLENETFGKPIMSGIYLCSNAAELIAAILMRSYSLGGVFEGAMSDSLLAALSPEDWSRHLLGDSGNVRLHPKKGKTALSISDLRAARPIMAKLAAISRKINEAHNERLDAMKSEEKAAGKIKKSGAETVESARGFGGFKTSQNPYGLLAGTSRNEAVDRLRDGAKKARITLSDKDIGIILSHKALEVRDAMVKGKLYGRISSIFDAFTGTSEARSRDVFDIAIEDDSITLQEFFGRYGIYGISGNVVLTKKQANSLRTTLMNPIRSLLHEGLLEVDLGNGRTIVENHGDGEAMVRIECRKKALTANRELMRLLDELSE
jgi:hypothetical protein